MIQISHEAGNNLEHCVKKKSLYYGGGREEKMSKRVEECFK